MLPFLYFIAVAAILFVMLRLSCGPCVIGRPGGNGAARLPLIPLGWALSLFLAVTYLACIGFDLVFPQYAMYETWSGLLPGFVWLTPIGFLIGLLESFLYGWYTALIFGGLFNVFVDRRKPA